MNAPDDGLFVLEYEGDPGPVESLLARGVSFADEPLPDTLHHALQEIGCAPAGEGLAALLAAMYRQAAAAVRPERTFGESGDLIGLLEGATLILSDAIGRYADDPRYEPQALRTALMTLAARMRRHGNFGVPHDEETGYSARCAANLRERIGDVASMCETLAPAGTETAEIVVTRRGAVVGTVMAACGATLLTLMTAHHGDAELPPKPVSPARVRSSRGDGKRDGPEQGKP